MVKSSKELMRFLPDDEMDEGKFPDRNFFWGLAFTVIPEWAKRYHKQVEDNRAKHSASPEKI